MTRRRPPARPSLPSALPAGPKGDVDGCTNYRATVGCVGFWWHAAGGPDVYNASGEVVPGYVYVDDSTPCGIGEPYPMDTFSAPGGSVACERDWVNYYRARQPGAVIYAALAVHQPLSARFANANATLLEWYPAYGDPGAVRCGAQAYIVQRYFNGSNAGGSQYSDFTNLWKSAAACSPAGGNVLGWY